MDFISPQFHVVFNDLQLCLYRWWYESVVEVIVFQHEHKLYAEDTLDKAGTIIYQPPPSSRCFAQLKLDYNKVANINFAYVVQMKISCMIAILLSQESHPYSVDTDMDNKVSPVAQHILDNNRVDSSHYSRDSESEGGIWDNNNVDNVSLAPKGGN